MSDWHGRSVNSPSFLLLDLLDARLLQSGRRPVEHGRRSSPPRPRSRRSRSSLEQFDLGGRLARQHGRRRSCRRSGAARAARHRRVRGSETGSTLRPSGGPVFGLAVADGDGGRRSGLSNTEPKAWISSGRVRRLVVEPGGHRHMAGMPTGRGTGGRNLNRPSLSLG